MSSELWGLASREQLQRYSEMPSAPFVHVQHAHIVEMDVNQEQMITPRMDVSASKLT